MAFGALGALPALGLLGPSMGFSPGLSMGLGLISGLAGGLLGPNKFPGYGDDTVFPGFGVDMTDVNYSANLSGYLGSPASVAFPGGYNAAAYAQSGFQYGAVGAPQGVGGGYLYGGVSPAQAYGYAAGYQAAGAVYAPAQGYPSPYTGGYFGGYQSQAAASSYFSYPPSPGYGSVLQGYAAGQIRLHPYPGHLFGSHPHPQPPKEHPELQKYNLLPEVIDDQADLTQASLAVKSRLVGDHAAQKVIHYGGKNPNNPDGFTDARLAVWKVLQSNPYLRYNVDKGNFFVTDSAGKPHNVMHVDDAVGTLRASYGYPQLARHLLRHQVDWAVDHYGVAYEPNSAPSAATYVAPINPAYSSNPYGFG